MKDKLTGVEALTTYSFRDIALPCDQALDVLTQNTMRSVRANMQLLLDSPGVDSPDRTAFMGRIREIHQNPEKFVPPGGISFSEEELRNLYQTRGSQVFRKVVGDCIGRISPSMSPRNLGNVHVGYMMDLLNTVNPVMASYDESLSELLNALRGVGMNMFVLGVMVDDAVQLKGTVKVPFDYFGDSQGATEFKNGLLPLLTPKESVEFVQGFTITREEMLREVGFN